MSRDSSVRSNQPLSPAITSWLDLHSKVLDGTGHLGRAPETIFTKGHYPRLPSLASIRFLPADAGNLFTTPKIPEQWYQICRNLSSSTPGSYNFSSREMDELVCNTGRDLSVVSDIDWLASGVSHLKEMAAAPEFQNNSYIFPLQRYLLGGL